MPGFLPIPDVRGSNDSRRVYRCRFAFLIPSDITTPKLCWLYGISPVLIPLNLIPVSSPFRLESSRNIQTRILDLHLPCTCACVHVCECVCMCVCVCLCVGYAWAVDLLYARLLIRTIAEESRRLVWLLKLLRISWFLFFFLTCKFIRKERHRLNLCDPHSTKIFRKYCRNIPSKYYKIAKIFRTHIAQNIAEIYQEYFQ